ncbi:MAG: GNAT family N-acetyltransferase [Oscillospiraceae bacterium]|nr:GNAT family N-acetyltransferase [Oscillospiraceae bacterium]
MMKIIALTHENARPAAKLAAQVFPYAAPYVRLSYWAVRSRNNPLVKLSFRIGRINALLDHWVAVNEHNEVIGTVGLYTYRKDAHEAAWLTWYCVAPQARGQGLGKELIAHAAQHARELGKTYLRLYTSTHPNEAAAQMVYEKAGLAQTHQKRVPGTTLIYREKKL